MFRRSRWSRWDRKPSSRGAGYWAVSVLDDVDGGLTPQYHESSRHVGRISLSERREVQTSAENSRTISRSYVTSFTWSAPSRTGVPVDDGRDEGGRSDTSRTEMALRGRHQGPPTIASATTLGRLTTAGAIVLAVFPGGRTPARCSPPQTVSTGLGNESAPIMSNTTLEVEPCSQTSRNVNTRFATVTTASPGSTLPVR